MRFLGILVGISLLFIPTASAVTEVQPPANLEVVEITEDSITVAWGPSPPGEFFIVDGYNNSVVVGWGASEDTRSPVTYTVEKNGEQVVTSLVEPSYRFNGLNDEENFRICVQARNDRDQLSPPTCGTISR